MNKRAIKKQDGFGPSKDRFFRMGSERCRLLRSRDFTTSRSSGCEISIV